MHGVVNVHLWAKRPDVKRKNNPDAAKLTRPLLDEAKGNDSRPRVRPPVLEVIMSTHLSD